MIDNDDRDLLDPALCAAIEKAFNNCKQMKMAIIIGIVVPFLMVPVAIIGLVYAYQRAELLQKVDLLDYELPEQEADRIGFLRYHKWRSLVPAIIVGCFIAFIVLTRV